jgi:hypothetical protein
MRKNEVENAARLARGEILDATRRFSAGEINFSGWQSECARSVKMVHAFAYLAAVGGPAKMTDARRSQMEDMVYPKIDRIWKMCVEFDQASEFNTLHHAVTDIASESIATFDNVIRCFPPKLSERFDTNGTPRLQTIKPTEFSPLPLAEQERREHERS